jgi:outer membrane protein, heavy metal efflux system
MAPPLLTAVGSSLILLVASCIGIACYHPRPLDDRLDRPRVAAPDQSSASARSPGAASQLSQLNPNDGLSVDEAVAIALVANPDLRAFRRERDIAEAQVVAVSAISNPTLRLELLHLQNLDVSSLGWGFALQWTPPQPGVWSAHKAQARARVEEARQQISEREWEIATRVRLEHATALEVEKQREPTRRMLDLRKRWVDAIELRVSQGASTRLEQTLATLALARLQQELADLEVRHATSVRTLMGLMGVAVGTTVRLEDSGSGAVPDEDAPALDVEDLARQALSNRPHFRAAAARYEQRDQALRAEQAKRWPWIRLSAMPRYRYNDTSSHPNDVGVAVDVTVPIFDWNTGNIAAAEADRRRQVDQLLADVASLRRDTAQECAEIEAQKATLKRFRTAILPTLDEQERILDAVFQGQQADLSTLLAAQETTLRIRREYVDLRLRYQKAWLDLARTVGALPSSFAVTRP